MNPTARTARKALPAAAALCVTALVAGCGSNGGGTASAGASSAGGQSPTAASAPASAPASATASSSAGTAGGGTGGAGTGGTQSASPASASGSHAAACATRSLRIAIGNAQGAAGSTYLALDFTNTSQATCSLYGYPGVSLAGGSPVRQIGLPAAENHGTARQWVTLKPHATAYATLRIVQGGNYPASTCHPVQAQYLKVYPPNQTASVNLRHTATACSSTSVRLLTVDAVRAGTGG